MQHIINPMNIRYPYQFTKALYKKEEKYTIYREAADPSIVTFKGRYYLFPSMVGGFYTSENLVDWDFHKFLNGMPIADYAPDACVIGDYIYFSASKKDEICSFYRSKDPLTQPFEEIEGSMTFWDPNLFQDDDKKLYFYWGCGNEEPLWGVELDKDSLAMIGKPIALMDSRQNEVGYERIGNDHIDPITPDARKEQLNQMIQGILNEYGENLPKEVTEEGLRHQLASMFSNRPYLEGAWVNKYQGKYYLQYAIPGTEFNIYGDGVYISDSPLGPYELANNNPYSYKPGGFLNGAGHGSTFSDFDGNYWHTSTNTISLNANFERRISLWKAGFDEDDELFCDQRFGDWPINITKEPFSNPDWMLLSYKKPVKVSSGTHSENIVNEDIKTFWQAEKDDSNPSIILDLEEICVVNTVQINFADASRNLEPSPSLKVYGDEYTERIIDTSDTYTRWILEYSTDGKEFSILQDKSKVKTDLPHDSIILEEGVKARYFKLTIIEVPYQFSPCLSAIRVFGNVEGSLPDSIESIDIVSLSDMDMELKWKEDHKAIGYNILWGYNPKKLYHSYMVFEQNEKEIRALIKGQPVYLRIDSFNKVGITEGTVKKIRDYEE